MCALPVLSCVLSSLQMGLANPVLPLGPKRPVRLANPGGSVHTQTPPTIAPFAIAAPSTPPPRARVDPDDTEDEPTYPNDYSSHTSPRDKQRLSPVSGYWGQHGRKGR